MYDDLKYYCGIGSRETPAKILSLMTEVATYLYLKKYTLNSGGAPGADNAFEAGVPTDLFKKIYLPWDGFNNKKVNGTSYIIPPYNEILVKKFHPNFSALSKHGKLLMSRNSYQVLGDDLISPVQFVLCWTSDGKASGGTGQAMRICYDKEIPVYNFNGDMKKIKKLLEDI